LSEYKLHNADVLIHDDSTVDDLIDVIEGNFLILIQEIENSSDAYIVITRLIQFHWNKLTC